MIIILVTDSRFSAMRNTDEVRNNVDSFGRTTYRHSSVRQSRGEKKSAVLIYESGDSKKPKHRHLSRQKRNRRASRRCRAISEILFLVSSGRTGTHPHSAPNYRIGIPLKAILSSYSGPQIEDRFWSEEPATERLFLTGR